ncbi:MAG: allophanate hydrolase subunit 2 family protein, partial [Kutzneria sp.]|nr:allophanate hydrolase subunit 2 family protein [Kutzneria sp.]
LANDPITVQLIPGPRTDWLADIRQLATKWTVSHRSDRIGIRLDGQPLRRHPCRIDQELPSEGVVRGAIQVPADGNPILFLADHPVTGGYPVVAVVRDAEVDLVAQAVPGQRILMSFARH